MLDRIKNIGGNSLRKSILILITGTTIAQIIPLLAEPLITRLYSKEDLGTLALYISFASLFSIIATARYELAIMLPKSDSNAVNLVGLSIVISFVLSIIVLLLVFAFNDAICKVLQAPQLSFFLYLVPISILLAGLTQSLNYWINRKQRYKVITYSKVSQSGINATFAVGFGFAAMKKLGLVSAYLAGQFFGLLPLLVSAWKKDRKQVQTLNKTESFEMAKKYSEFPTINSLHAFVDILQLSLVSFLIAYFFSDEVLGTFSRTYRILLVPVSLISVAFGQVFYQRASMLYSQNSSIKPLVIKTITTLAVISFLGFGFLALIAPDFFEIFLGKGWRDAGVFAQFMAPWMFIRFIIAPLSYIPIIVSKQRTNFLLGIIGNVIIVSSLWYAGEIAENLQIGLLLISIFMVLFYTLVLFWYLKIIKN